MTSTDPEEVDVTAIARAQRGDPRAIDQVIRMLMPYLGRICGAIALDNGEDALQETLWIITRQLASLREPRALRSWARRIAVNEALRHTKSRFESTLPESLITAGAESPSETAVDVREILQTLSPDQRVVLALQHFDGLSEEEIATAIGVPVGTVKSRLSRARAEFRTRWTT